MDYEFTGPSANYLRQQTRIAVQALAPLQKLGPEVELQALRAVIAACEERMATLPVPQQGQLTVGDVLSVAAGDVGSMEASL